MSPASVPSGSGTRPVAPRWLVAPTPVEPSPGSDRQDRLVLDRLPVGVLLLDGEQTVRMANATLTSLLGREVPRDGIEAWLQAVAPNPRLGEEIARQWREYVWQKQLPRVWTLRHRDGGLREIEMQPRQLDNGDLMVILRDVTEDQRREEALRLSESRWEGLYHKTGSAVALVEPSGRLVDANAAFERLTGYRRAELVKLGVADCIEPEDFGHLCEVERRLAAARGGAGSGTPMEQGSIGDETLLVRIRTRGGDLVPVRASLAPVRGLQGRAEFTVLIADREREPEAPGAAVGARPVDEVLAARALAFGFLRDAVIVTTPRGRIQEWNAAATAAFGCEAAAVQGEGLARFFAPPDGAASFNRDLSQALTESGRWDRRGPFFRADGSQGEANQSFLAVIDGDEARGLVVIQWHDPATPADAPAPAPAVALDRDWALMSRLLTAESGAGARIGALPVALKIHARVRAMALLQELAGDAATVGLADYTRRLVADLLKITTDARGGAPSRFKIRADESLVAPASAAGRYGLLVAEMVLGAMVPPASVESASMDQPPHLVLSLFEGHPRIDFSAPAPASAGVSEAVLRPLAEELKASLRLETREGRSHWLVRFPLTADRGC